MKKLGLYVERACPALDIYHKDIKKDYLSYKKGACLTPLYWNIEKSLPSSNS